MGLPFGQTKAPAPQRWLVVSVGDYLETVIAAVRCCDLKRSVKVRDFSKKTKDWKREEYDNADGPLNISQKACLQIRSDALHFDSNALHFDPKVRYRLISGFKLPAHRSKTIAHLGCEVAHNTFELPDIFLRLAD
jgi:hypothetical protein